MGFAQNTRTPILRLNSRHDTTVPAAMAQRLYDALGTPLDHKRPVLYDGPWHWPLPRAKIVREVGDWLDRYFGPVDRCAVCLGRVQDGD